MTLDLRLVWECDNVTMVPSITSDEIYSLILIHNELTTPDRKSYKIYCLEIDDEFDWVENMLV